MIYILEELMHFFLERHHDHDSKDTTNTTVRHDGSALPNQTKTFLLNNQSFLHGAQHFQTKQKFNILKFGSK
jgi:hypothetical protein